MSSTSTDPAKKSPTGEDNPFDTASEIASTTAPDTEVSSLDTASTQEDALESSSGFPTNAYDTVLAGTALQVTNTKATRSGRGLLFSHDRKETYLAEFQHRNSSSARPEVIVHRCASNNNNGDEAGTKKIGSVNFHHWLRDRSAAVEVTLAGDSDPTTTTTPADPKPDIRRQGIGAEHNFTYRGKQYSWRLSRGTGDERVFWRRHMKCVDSSGEVYAFFTIQANSFEGSGKEKRVGRFEIRAEGVDVRLAEALVVTFAALWVKHEKRVGQNMLSYATAGVGGLGLYAVQG